jgi:SapC
MSTDLNFVPPPEPGDALRFRPVLRHGWLGSLGIMPIADRELLNIAHHAPLVVVCGVGEPSVQALVRDDLTLLPAVDRTGRWRPVYQPLALRALPFLLLDPAGAERRPALISGIPDSALGAPVPFHGDFGARRPEAALALHHLEPLHAGARALGAAAETLLAAGLLAPIRLAGEAAIFFDSMELMTPDPRRIASITPARAAALGRHGRLALDLLMAAHFSTRLLVPAARPLAVSPSLQSGLALDLEPAPAEIDAPGVGFDDSPLFSIEAFLVQEAERRPGRDAPGRLAG